MEGVGVLNVWSSGCFGDVLLFLLLPPVKYTPQNDGLPPSLYEVGLGLEGASSFSFQVIFRRFSLFQRIDDTCV